MVTDLVLGAEQLQRWHHTVERAVELLSPFDDGDTSTFQPKRWQALADAGFHGLTVAPEYGGHGADALTIATTVDALGYACTDNGMLFSVGAHVWSAVTPIQRFGNDDQKRRYLPGLGDGSLVGVQAMTEPGSGSDAFSLGTTATLDGDDVVLDGSKTFITNAPVADVFVVFASLDRAKGWAGLSAFLVDKGTPGLTVSSQMRKLGINSSPFGELHFDECRVPVANSLGKLGAGMMIFTHSMDFERTFILGPALGTMRRQVERCAQLAGDTSARTRPLLHQIVGAMAQRLHVTRLLYYRTAQRRALRKTALPDAAILKLALSEAWSQSCRDQIDAHALVGRGMDLQSHTDLHDSVGSRIYSGTSEIQRDLVGQQLKLP
jgi:alkylation response protein AidB-like acyl-CoA dehydrogenase